MMPRASAVQDGDYVPPREITHDLDKQYELRKRKLAENQYYEGPDVPQSSGGDRKRAKMNEFKLPPRPTTPEINAQHHPPEWCNMNRTAQKNWNNREKQKLAETRMKLAMKYLHYFSSPREAAIHFRVSIKQLENKLHLKSQKHQGLKNKTSLAHQPPRGHIAENEGPSDATEQVRTQQETQGINGPEDEDLKASSTQPAQLPPLTREDCEWVKPAKWDSMKKKAREQFRREALTKLKEARLRKAVDCYKQGMYTDLKQGAHHFQVHVKALMAVLGLSPENARISRRRKTLMKRSEQVQHESAQHQSDNDNQATEPLPPEAEDVSEHIKPDPEMAESQSISAVASYSPFSAEEEHDLVKEIKRRIVVCKQPSLSRVRDIANVRVIDRDGLNAPMINDNWVRDFISRHEYLRNVYKLPQKSNNVADRGRSNEQGSVCNSDVKHSQFDSGTSSISQNETVPQPDPGYQFAEPTPSAQTSPAAIDQPPEGVSISQHNSENHAAITPIAQEDHSAVSPAASHAPFQATESRTSITAQGHSHYSDRYSPASTYLPDSTTGPDPRTDQYPSARSTHSAQNEGVSNSISEMSEREPPPRYLTDLDIEIRLRITYNDDTRIVALDPEIHISALMQKVAQKFGTTRPLRLQISDKDGMITIGDQEDLSFVLADTRKWGAREGREIVQLQVFVKEV